MRRDPRVFLIGEDIGVYGGAFKVTQGFQQEFGEDRVIDSPLSETAITGACTGAALMGMRPVCEMQFSDFVSCAFDQLVTVAAKHPYHVGTPVPIVVRLPSGGGFSCGPFHSQNPEGFFAHCPGLKIVCPATPADAKGLLIQAIRDPNPVLYFEHKHLYRRIKGEVPEGEHTVEFGHARTHREGTDLTIVTYGAMVYTAEEAADAVAEKDGTSVEIVDLRTVTPWDKQAVMESDETIVEMPTDKVDTEVPSPATGVVRELLAGEGETVPVYTKIAVIDTGGGDEPAASDGGGDGAASVPGTVDSPPAAVASPEPGTRPAQAEAPKSAPHEGNGHGGEG